MTEGCFSGRSHHLIQLHYGQASMVVNSIFNLGDKFVMLVMEEKARPVSTVIVAFVSIFDLL